MDQYVHNQIESKPFEFGSEEGRIYEVEGSPEQFNL
jgi:hypothetical protein